MNMKRPAFIALLFLIAGRILGSLFPWPSLLLLIALSFLILRVFILEFTRRHHPRASGLLLFIAVFLIGFYQQRYLDESDRRAGSLARRLNGDGAVTIQGQMLEEPSWRRGRPRIRLGNLELVREGEFIPVPGSALVYCYNSAAKKILTKDPARWDHIRIRGETKIPTTHRNPLLFDYRSFLARKGIHQLYRIKDADAIEIHPHSGPLRLVGRILLGIHHFRLRCERNFESLLEDRDAALLKGLVLGRSHEIDPEDREMFLRTGLMHLFAVSGLHTGMIALFLFFMLRFSRFRFQTIAVLTTAGVWLFGAYTGFRAPVVRAAIMISCLLGSQWISGLRRSIESISSLSFAAFWVLILSPRALFQADFLFSYITVFMIILLHPFFKQSMSFDLEHSPPGKRALPAFLNRWVLFPFYTVLSAQLALVPLLALYYHRFSPSALVANPLAVPLAFLCMISAMSQVFLGFLAPGLTPGAAWITGNLLSVLRGVVGVLSRAPAASVGIASFPWLCIGLYYLILLGGNWILEKKKWKPRRRISFLFSFTILVLILVWSPLVGGAGDEMKVIFLDVGQGDCTYIEFPGGGNILIDGGRNYPENMGKSVVLPYLESRGINTIDVIIATHADSDHIGGLPYLLDHMFVQTVIEGPSHSSTKVYQELNRKIEEWGVTRKTAAGGDFLRGYPGAMLQFVSPPRHPPRYWDNNELSLVLYVKKKRAAFLFTGDAGLVAEQYMVKSDLPLEATVLKTGHHGSSTSTGEALLDAVNPRAAVISAGESNPYGHPHKEVLERLKSRDIRIFRTDTDGAVLMRVRKNRIIVETGN